MRICQSKELRDFQNELNQRFRLCCYNGICRFAPTGEEYINFSPTATTKKAVIEEFKRAIREYIKNRSSIQTIYWRKYPELQKWCHGFQIYSRLLISPVSPDEDLVMGAITMQEYNEQNQKLHKRP